MYAQNKDTVKIAVELLRETEAAFLVTDGDRQVWIPKSQLVDFDYDEPGTLPGFTTTIEIPEWLAKAKGLI